MPTPINSPATFVPPHAVAYADTDATAVVVSTNAPLPVSVIAANPIAVSTVPAATTPLAGTATTSRVVGPYQPVSGRTVILALSGTWSGAVQVLRSTDGGTTKLPITIGGAVWGLFSVNCCEGVWDESEPGAQLYLQINLTAGAVTYRLAQ